MQWPEETNAVAGGDTFWTLITRDCCIILNWVHLKKSRIIFFVIVTYWQSMARFRKNDFFKWAQKIKSVFCFNPHTHEGCDFLFLKFLFQLHVSIHTPTKGVTDLFVRSVVAKPFQSTHPRRVWLSHSRFTEILLLFQSTHPRRVWHAGSVAGLVAKIVSIHTPTKGVTQEAAVQGAQNKVSIHTPTKGVTSVWQPSASTLLVSIHTPTKGVTDRNNRGSEEGRFQSTHPRRVWLSEHSSWIGICVSIHTPTKGVTVVGACCKPWRCVSIHTPTKGVTGNQLATYPIDSVSIHTPTKGVTYPYRYGWVPIKFQSTHPRRVWLGILPGAKRGCYVSIHTPTKGVTLEMTKLLSILQFQSTHPRRVWLFCHSLLIVSC